MSGIGRGFEVNDTSCSSGSRVAGRHSVASGFSRSTSGSSCSRESVSSSRAPLAPLERLEVSACRSLAPLAQLEPLAVPAGTVNLPQVLRPQVNWEKLYFYQKTVVLYHMTYVFCRRFLPKYGDRTVDQMIQAARSGKQNIVEGFADGVTSFELELKLLNVARASLKELKEDYVDYIHSRGLVLWGVNHCRYNAMLSFCRTRNKIEEYKPFFGRWTDEEFANCANTLCHMVDKMMSTHLKIKEVDFTENGGIRERMTAARLGRRQTQNEEIAALKAENARLLRALAGQGGSTP